MARGAHSRRRNAGGQDTMRGARGAGGTRTHGTLLDDPGSAELPDGGRETITLEEWRRQNEIPVGTDHARASRLQLALAITAALTCRYWLISPWAFVAILGAFPAGAVWASACDAFDRRRDQQKFDAWMDGLVVGFDTAIELYEQPAA